MVIPVIGRDQILHDLFGLGVKIVEGRPEVWLTQTAAVNYFQCGISHLENECKRWIVRMKRG